MSKTLLKELRTAAMCCSNVDYRTQLAGAADTLNERTMEFVVEQSRDAMIALNGAWARGEALLKNVPAEADPNPPLAGAPEAARLAA